jgi:hypothetical protein
MARSHGFFHTDDKGMYRGIGTLYLMPALMLAIRAFLDVRLVDGWDVLPFGLVLAALMAIAAVGADRRLLQKPSSLIMAVIVAMAYGYGAVAQADMLLDNGRPETFTTVVQHEHIAGNYRTPHRYILTVDAWGPHEAGDITVSAATFAAVNRGDKVCIVVSPGAFGLPWYAAQPCR